MNNSVGQGIIHIHETVVRAQKMLRDVVDQNEPIEIRAAVVHPLSGEQTAISLKIAEAGLTYYMANTVIVKSDNRYLVLNSGQFDEVEVSKLEF